MNTAENSSVSSSPSQNDGFDGRPMVFYDGGCPLCRREIGHYRRLDKAGRVNWLDLHSHPEELDRLGVTWEQAMKRMHACDAEGRLTTGAYAFVTVWSALPGYRWLARVVSAIPGVLPVMDFGYGIFARYRRRQPATCELPKDS
ncbi:MAG: DUF393 domain-containing protein [Chromatiaceae bacterium]|nr:MAG: DUF393 domain-containing protein [Chromatiaceae bacterium]